jgi:ADP-ribosylglycohydrolase
VDQPFSVKDPDHDARMERVKVALDGLSVGDALGERFFFPSNPRLLIEDRVLPAAPWRYTDDTVMALCIAEVLHHHRHIHQEELAYTFARQYWNNPQRGYGATAHDILQAIARGVSWRKAAREAFDGDGSMGNGGAMRVAPVAAYYADDLDQVVAAARASAEVTHGHREGQAGAIAVAVAAAYAWQNRGRPGEEIASELFRVVLEHTPKGDTREGIAAAAGVPFSSSVKEAVDRLGNGCRVTAPDTVPFALWCAARHLNSYVDAIWTTIEGFGDIDTNCAIVGGIVALHAGAEAIPQEWIAAREWIGW